MADAWLPMAERLSSEHEGGMLKGGAPRVVWHTSESDPGMVCARSAAQGLERQGRSAHLVWNPRDGEIVQMVPATRAARTLPGEVGCEGRVCVQIVVVGFARDPFTCGPLNGVEAIAAWLDSWRVPRRWPAGAPPGFPDAYLAMRSRRAWARGGHFGASQVPQAVSPAPGAIDIHKITELETPLAMPRLRLAPVADSWAPSRLPAPAPASNRS